MRIIIGRSNPSLANKICSLLDRDPLNCSLSSFSDGELSVNVHDTVRGEDCFIIQSTCSPVNDNLMELILIVDALRRSSAKSISAVIPYFGYCRQDRMASPRQPISAKVVANLLTGAGVDRVITMDMHTDQMQGFFDIPVDHIYSNPIFKKHMLDNYGSKELALVSPDAGSMKRTNRLAKDLSYPVAMIDKRRLGPNKIKSMGLLGDVKGKIAIIFDDIVDTGGTLVKAGNLLRDSGASDVMAYVTHGVFSGDAKENIFGKESPFSKVHVANTIPLGGVGNSPMLEIIDMSEIFAKVIKRLQSNDSLSPLFD